MGLFIFLVLLIKTNKMRGQTLKLDKVDFFSHKHYRLAFSAAILVNRAINAEKTPSELLIPKVSLSQNKCKIFSDMKIPQDYRPDTGLQLERI